MCLELRCTKMGLPSVGVSVVGAKPALCSGPPVDGKACSTLTVAQVSGGGGGGGAPKPESTYVDRLKRLVHLMDPRHALTTGDDIRRYQGLLKERAAGKVRKGARSRRWRHAWCG